MTGPGPTGSNLAEEQDYLTDDEAFAVVDRLGFHVRDAGLLSSAIARPRTTVFGEDAYPDLATKAAALFESLVRNHPLLDGNKRLAVVLTFSAHLERGSEALVTLEQAAAVTGIFAICVVTAICYTRLKFITQRVSPAAAQALSRILAFFVFCIGVEIALTGWRALHI